MNRKRPIPAPREDLELEVFPEAEVGSATLVAEVLDRREHPGQLGDRGVPALERLQVVQRLPE